MTDIIKSMDMMRQECTLMWHAANNEEVRKEITGLDVDIFMRMKRIKELMSDDLQSK